MSVRRSPMLIRSAASLTDSSCSSNGSSSQAKASRVLAASEVVSIRAPSVSSATPTIPVMLTPRSASACATRASAPGRSSSWTVNQTITGATSCSIDGSRYASAMVTPAGPRAQVFGMEDSPSTRAALRFFKERRVEVHVVDLRRKPMAPGELRRFVERLGARAIADEEGRAWRDAGLGYLRMDDSDLAVRLLADQRLLRLPL